jgi:ferrochelatase
MQEQMSEIHTRETQKTSASAMLLNEKIAVILVNLGTPDAPTPRAVRRFLGEFLWDDRVIKRNPLWWLVLNTLVLTFRPKRVAEAYKTIWQSDSPMRVIGQSQVDQLNQRQGAAGHLEYFMAMTYGKPSLKSLMKELQDKGYQRWVILPLYPQYSATTTGAVYDQVNHFALRTRNIPEYRIVKEYYHRPDYIEVLASSIERHWQEHGRHDRLLFSFHGVPKSYVLKGDPYQAACYKSAHETAQRLGLNEGEYFVSFQSRFGPTEWLQPYTDKLLTQWGHEGVKSVDVICPAFAVDCLETLEEISVENRDIFIEAGGKAFSYIPALNDSEEHIQFLETLTMQTIQDWMEKWLKSGREIA